MYIVLNNCSALQMSWLLHALSERALFLEFQGEHAFCWNFIKLQDQILLVYCNSQSKTLRQGTWLCSSVPVSATRPLVTSERLKKFLILPLRTISQLSLYTFREKFFRLKIYYEYIYQFFSIAYFVLQFTCRIGIRQSLTRYLVRGSGLIW